MSYRKVLSETIIRYLNGDSEYGIFEDGGIFDETEEIRKYLVIMNENDVLTSCSQPGEDSIINSGTSKYKQRAFVCGYVHKDKENIIMKCLNSETLVFISDIKSPKDVKCTIPVTISIPINPDGTFGEEVIETKCGHATPSEELACLKDHIRDSNHIRNFNIEYKFFCVIDTVWGRKDYIFKLITSAL